MTRIRLPFINAYTDRHGKPRFYLKRPGFKQVPLTGTPGSEEFRLAYEAALVSYTFSGIEPPGAYTWYSVLTRPGTLEFVTPLQQVAFTLN